MSSNRTISEPIAVPAEPGDADVKRLTMASEDYDYVKVEPRPRNWVGAWKSPGDYRRMGYGIVPLPDRDDTDVELIYPSRKVTDGHGNEIEVPEDRELLHPGVVLMARRKAIGDAERAKLDLRNNPEPLEPGDVPLEHLQGRDGVVQRVNKRVKLGDIDELPSKSEIAAENKRRESAAERADRDSSGKFTKALEGAASNDSRLAD